MATVQDLDPVIIEKVLKVAKIGTPLMAEMLNCSPESVQEYVRKGIIKNHGRGRNFQFIILDSVQAFVEHLRTVAAGRNKDERMRDLEEQKLEADVEYKKARARRATLEAEEMDGKLHKADDVAAVITNIVIAMRGMLLAMPGRLALDISKAKTAKEASAMLEQEVHQVLEELSGYKYDAKEFRRRMSEREGFGEEDDEDDA